MTTTKPALLYLCHRIPYPPDKGDKIRSYHLLRYLAEHYTVFLGCFWDDEDDRQHIPYLKTLCREVLCVPLPPLGSKIKSLSGLFKGEPMTLPYYADSGMQKWVRSQLVEHNIKRCVAFSSAMAQYLIDVCKKDRRIVLDLVDVDSDKWRQYSTTKSFPMNWLYRREADKLLEFERKISGLADRSFLVSSAEARLFKRLVPDQEHKIGFYNNGVDTDYFDPNLDYKDPYRDPSPILVFTGAMDYWPNVDAVVWFVRAVFPALKQMQTDLKFYIVGRNPTRKVRCLEETDGVVVTGKVEDVRPYLKYATAVVAPLRLARGVQNKVLEAMAMEKVVMTSAAGLEGIEAELGAEILLTNSLEDYQEFLPTILKNSTYSIAQSARSKVLKDFNWNNTLPKVGEWLEQSVARELEHE
ncbi:TIGR03087 family PEP-CTERM/XrtA system glycosyltransferase [Pseudomaricurvus sp.]|uniref:TIGR03087 family PEP-CTERM/XrtA system glycosyltransferase n=1 Tax=Pseudomaricurvus sp. TaxID=2004510 RepID=UPI003F6CD234